MNRTGEEWARCKVEGCERPREAGRTECACHRKRRLRGNLPPEASVRAGDWLWREAAEAAIHFADVWFRLEAAALTYAEAETNQDFITARAKLRSAALAIAKGS